LKPVTTYFKDRDRIDEIKKIGMMRKS